MEAVEAPDIVGVLAGAGEGAVQPQIGAVNGFGLFNPVLLEQQRPEGMAGGLHEAPGLVVAHGVVEFDRLVKMGKGFFEIEFPVFDFAFHHLGGDGENIEAGIVEQAAGFRHAGQGFFKQAGFLFRCWHIETGGVSHGLGVVQHGGGHAIEFLVGLEEVRR